MLYLEGTEINQTRSPFSRSLRLVGKINGAKMKRMKQSGPWGGTSTVLGAGEALVFVFSHPNHPFLRLILDAQWYSEVHRLSPTWDKNKIRD